MVEPVRKTIRVKATVERSFRVFTDEFDSWWPKSHHIGTSPMKKAMLEGEVGGRCYSQQEDGSDCPWGTVLVWDPPQRFVMAWQVTPAWQYEPEISKCSEVEVRFTSEGDGITRVDLEHRYFERHGDGVESMQAMVNSDQGGWGKLLELYQEKVEF